MGKKLWIVVAGIVVIAVAAAGCQAIAAQNAEAQDFETAVVRQDMLRITVDATGSLAPRSEVSASFSSSGRVAEVWVEEGQVVEAGQPLAQLETDDLELQVAQAEAALAAAEVQLAQLTAPARPEEVAAQEANLAAMEAQVNAAAANRDQVVASVDEGQIAAAEAQLAATIAQQKSAFDAHEMTIKCFTLDLPAGVTLPDGTVLPEGGERKICPALGAPEERARYALAAADASLASAQAQLDELLAGADDDQLRAAQASVTTAVAQRDAAQAQLDLTLAGPTPEQMETVQASVADARVALAQARLRLEKATLTAPVAGAVTFVGVQPGEIANASQPVIVLSDLATLEVKVSLDETDVVEVSVGQEVRVRVDAFPGVEMMGEVTYIAPVAQELSGVVLYPVIVQLTLPGPSASAQIPSVRAGMTADVSIVTASREHALIVPLRAIKTEGERAYVDRLVGDQLQRVPVSLGLMTDAEVEITDGLSTGDTVVVVASAAQNDFDRPSGPMGMFGGGGR